ncbi:hypothetical protein CYMTET_35010, partial [Cymbomonas tetramitiformis]
APGTLKHSRPDLRADDRGETDASNPLHIAVRDPAPHVKEDGRPAQHVKEDGRPAQHVKEMAAQLSMKEDGSPAQHVKEDAQLSM